MMPSGPSAAMWTRRDVAIGLVLSLVVLAVYWPVRHFGYVRFDDPIYLFENPHAARGLTLASARWAFTSQTLGNYMPVALLSSLLDVSLWGMNPGPMHFENAFIHALTTSGWYLLWVRLTGRRGRSFAVAGVFGLHPMHVEPVAWIVERGDVLCILLIVGSLLAFTQYVQTGRRALYFISIALFPVALLAKSIAVVLPGLIFLLQIWPLRRVRWGRSIQAEPLEPGNLLAAASVSWRCATLELVPFLLIGLAGAVMAVLSRTAAHASAPLNQWTAGDRLANVVFGYTLYLVKAIWPEPMLVFYPLKWNYSNGAVIGATGLLVALTSAAVRIGRRRPYVIVGWLWWMGTLLPSIGIVQASRQAIADRYTYLPYVGLSIIIIWWTGDVLASLTAGKRALNVVIGSTMSGIILLICAIESRRQIWHWRTSYALFSHTAEFEPDDPGILNDMGTEYRIAGELDLALQAYGRSVQVDPNQTDAQTNLAGMLMRIDPGQALPHFQRAVQLSPSEAMCWWNLGVCQQQLRDIPAAIESFRTALRLDSTFEPARVSLLGLERGT